MSAEQHVSFDRRTQGAVDELRAVIREHYPTASFAVSKGGDDPEAIHLTATVDVDDPDEVLDLVIDRVVELQVEERIPLYVMPIRTPERVLAEMQSRLRPPRRSLRIASHLKRLISRQHPK